MYGSFYTSDWIDDIFPASANITDFLFFKLLKVFLVCTASSTHCLEMLKTIPLLFEGNIFAAWLFKRNPASDLMLILSAQVFPGGSASFVLIGELRPRRPSRDLTVRSRLVPPNPLQSSLQTTRARRPVRHFSPSCISHPIEGTQDPSHSRHSASGKRGTPKKEKKELEIWLQPRLVNTASDLWVWPYEAIWN